MISVVERRKQQRRVSGLGGRTGSFMKWGNQDWPLEKVKAEQGKEASVAVEWREEWGEMKQDMKQEGLTA